MSGVGPHVWNQGVPYGAKCVIWLVIPNLPNSENGRLLETETNFPINTRFQIYLGENEVYS